VQAIPIEDIVTIATANLVLGALLLSLVGATVAVTVRHLTAQNWHVHWQDVWYFIFSGGISVALVLLGMDTVTILTATTGINTPLAILKTTMDKYSEKKSGVDVNSLKIQALESQLAYLTAKAKAEA